MNFKHSVVKHHQSDLLVSTQYGRRDLLHFKYKVWHSTTVRSQNNTTVAKNTLHC